MSRTDLVDEARALAAEFWEGPPDVAVPANWQWRCAELLRSMLHELHICEACGSPLAVYERLGMALSGSGSAWLCQRCVTGHGAAARCRQLMAERAAVVEFALRGTPLGGGA